MAFRSDFDLNSSSGNKRTRQASQRGSQSARLNRVGNERPNSRKLSQSPRSTNRMTVDNRASSSYTRRPQPNGKRMKSSTSKQRSSQGVSRDMHSHRISHDARADAGKRKQKAAPQSSGHFIDQPYASSQKGNTSILGIIIDLISMGINALVKLALLAGKWLISGFLWIWDRNKIAGGAIACVVALALLFGIDTVLTGSKIYKGIYVGDVDVSGMTQQQATEAISARYNDKLTSTSIYIYSSEDAARNVSVDQALKQEEALAEQTSVEKHLKNKVLWVESADSLGARLPAEEMAAEAVNFGRSTGIFDRFSTLMRTHVIPARVEYNDTILSNLVGDLDIAIGNPVQEFSIQVKDGQASVVDGHDGYMINRDVFTNTLTDKFLNSEVNDPRYIPVAEYINLKITKEEAQKTADVVNEVLSEGASFSYNSKNAEIDKQTLGNWIETETAQRKNNQWYLKPMLSENKALKSLTKKLSLNENGQHYKVSFSGKGSNILVMPDQTITVPNVGSALDNLNQVLFGSYCESGSQRISGTRYNIGIDTRESSEPLSLDEAQAYGVVSTFSSFTTKINLASSTLNRLYNIQKAADLINDSITKANGGRWSFNQTAGDCNTENGFKNAGVVKGDEMTDAPGGGVCQVATTVFNAVYDAGLSFKERHNHTIQPASYPAGRDAAIAYPTLDLVWQNNTQSDILLQTTYDNKSITVNLIGEDPERTVTTSTGEWEKGDLYKTKFVLGENYSENAIVKTTKGVDGATITVVRTVVDKNGQQLEQNTFTSKYSPINEVYKVGSGVDQTEAARKYARSEEEEEAAKNSPVPGSTTSSTSSSSSSSKTTNTTSTTTQSTGSTKNTTAASTSSSTTKKS